MSEVKNEVTIEQRHTLRVTSDGLATLVRDGNAVLCFQHQIPFSLPNQLGSPKIQYVFCGNQCAKFKFGNIKNQKGEDIGNHAQLLCGGFPVYHKLEEERPEDNKPGLSLV